MTLKSLPKMYFFRFSQLLFLYFKDFRLNWCSYGDDTDAESCLRREIVINKNKILDCNLVAVSN